ncbi:MAG TPA: TcpE family conjugal transfer membrane protein [Streptosporangiaceae bacterium]
MELPTYTNIWKIEKRLYKLYDFRLPMPLPVGQIAAFLAIAIPYMLVLTLMGMPFSHTWVWLYVLPPGAAAWLVTRPVLEGKRLPELVASQMRYLTEPRTWCRLAPLAEEDHIAVVARVWRAQAGPARDVPAEPDEASAATAQPTAAARPGWPDHPAVSGRVGTTASKVPADAVARVTEVAPIAGQDLAATAIPSPARAAVGPDRKPASYPGAVAPDDGATDIAEAPEITAAADSGPDSAPVAAQVPIVRPAPSVRPGLRVRANQGGGRPLHVVERALRTSPGGWHDSVVVVPGGHRPGTPDHAQRDQARTRLPLAGPVRIVVLGTTAGAGQTVTALLTGQLLASLRGEAVAVLDFGGRPGSVTELARQVPRLLPGQLAGQLAGDRTPPDRDRGLQVVTADHSGSSPRDADRVIGLVAARYPITLADPAPADVPRAVQIADQLVLVTPASASSAGSLAMTLEWLEAHGHSRLAQTSVTVLNGVSKQTADDAERATTVAAGRCRAIVRVPWDGSLGASGQLSTATINAYTALAGVLVSGLADPALVGSAGAGSASP